jgi:hypothetical protein
MVRAHHWSEQRHARKMAIVKFVEENAKTFPDGILEGKLMQVMVRKLRTSPRAIREYLYELVNVDGLLELRDGKYFPVKE